MLDRLTITDTMEEVVTTRVVTATFSFTDEDLKEPEVQAFYDMIAPREETEDDSANDGFSQ